MPTTFAPASASAAAIPLPMPRLAPVTSATLPSSLNESRMLIYSLPLLQRRHGHGVHIRESLVFACHRPDEGVIARAHPGMDRPAWRDHRLFAANDQMARLVRLAHQVKDHVVGV